MKQIAIISLFVLTGFFFSPASFAQNEALDTIIKVEGKVLLANVTKVTTTYIRFMFPDNDELFTLPRKEIHKIVYRNGRVEDFNPMVAIMVDDMSWEAIWLTEDPQDVAYLHRRGVVKSQSSPSARSPKAAKTNATIRLQKKAASMSGTVVLVTKRQATGGYGEFPGYYIEGVVYGTEPLDVEEGTEEL
ncbi:MAG: hypothetical protein IPM71_04960 [Bacteroidota bacterium]|nr:MAG: hypothetical protein IPM71_04960 [Bacteroidota bacterium]